MASLGLLSEERRAVFPLAGIFGLRLFGLFALLPVMSLAEGLYPGATAEQMGLALGIYGLSQGLFQLPFGVLSDRYPRHIVVTFGLFIFVLGSVVAAEASTIYGLLLGRAIQGAGAVGSCLLAMIADTTRDTVRNRAMAMVGGMVGLAFVLAMVLSPILFAAGGLKLIFWLIAGFTLLAIGVLWKWVPRSPPNKMQRPVLKEQLKALFSDKQLLGLTTAVLLLHALLTLLFLALPKWLISKWGLAATDTSWFYAGALLLMLIGFVPWVMKLDRSTDQSRSIRMAALCMSLALALLFVASTVYVALVLLALFFVGFNVLETVLPAATSQAAKARDKGAALGLFSTAQFVGTFIGGSIGGVILASWHEKGVLAAALTVACGLYGLGMYLKK